MRIEIDHEINQSAPETSATAFELYGFRRFGNLIKTGVTATPERRKGACDRLFLGIILVIDTRVSFAFRG